MAKVDPTDPAVIDVRAFRRAGEMKNVQRTVVLDPAPGNPVVHLEPNRLDVQFTLESVIEGVWLAATAHYHLVGQCSRCLAPISLPRVSTTNELFSWDPIDLGEDSTEAVSEIHDGYVDARELLTDAVVLDLPLAPVCDDNCPGLCPECGILLADNPDHVHQVRDSRWDALAGLELKGE